MKKVWENPIKNKNNKNNNFQERFSSTPTATLIKAQNKNLKKGVMLNYTGFM